MSGTTEWRVVTEQACWDYHDFPHMFRAAGVAGSPGSPQVVRRPGRPPNHRMRG
jgi:hypothetical protein